MTDDSITSKRIFKDPVHDYSEQSSRINLDGDLIIGRVMRVRQSSMVHGFAASSTREFRIF